MLEKKWSQEEINHQFTKEIESKIRVFFEHQAEKREKIKWFNLYILKYIRAGILYKETKKQAQICFEKEKEEDFTKCILDCLDPLIKFHKVSNENALFVEQLERKRFNQKGGFFEVNETLSYEVANSEIKIHLPQAKDFIRIKGQKAYIEKIIQGLFVVGGVVNKNKEIDWITGFSVVVSNRPNFIKSLGFSIKDEDLDKIPKNKKERDLHTTPAFMARDDFLKKYYKELNE